MVWEEGWPSPICTGQKVGGVVRVGGDRGHPAPMRHLCACCSSRSTASARLSTYPSACTSGWRSSLGLHNRVMVSQGTRFLQSHTLGAARSCPGPWAHGEGQGRTGSGWGDTSTCQDPRQEELIPACGSW